MSSWKSKIFLNSIILLCCFFTDIQLVKAQTNSNSTRLQHYVAIFNANDLETVVNHIPNKDAATWMMDNIPIFECPDTAIERTYYFRWWVYRKHIKQTPQGYVITEFLPEVPWAGKYNTISCPAGHHFYEGRWLRDARYLKEYANFWFHGGGSPRLYSFWAADAMYQMFKVTNDTTWITGLLPDLVKNYQGWESTNLDANGLFWQIDDRDGMEVSIGGSGYRATINSYMYGDARAIAEIARLAKQKNLEQEYTSKSEKIKQLVLDQLWDEEDKFFKVLPRTPGAKLADVRELHGYVPWYFNLPDNDSGCAIAWKDLMDSTGFFAPYGPTTAERRHNDFMFKNDHECLWNGPSWPFATTQTLVALANLLNMQDQPFVNRKEYFQLLRIYTNSQQRQTDDGTIVPWIDENLDPFTGEWLARSIMQKTNRPDRERGKDYNHSSYADLIISGLIGLRPRADNQLEINPLLPIGTWDYFLLEKIPYRGHELTILYDKTGNRYKKGKGFMVFSDEELIVRTDDLLRVTVSLNEIK